MNKAVIELEPWLSGASEEDVIDHIKSISVSIDNVDYLKKIKEFELENQHREELLDFIDNKIEEFEHDLYKTDE